MSWYESTALGAECDSETHCSECELDGWCDTCDTICGRYIPAVMEYVATCDRCLEPTHEDLLRMDPDTQLCYCVGCRAELSLEMLARMEFSCEEWARMKVA